MPIADIYLVLQGQKWGAQKKPPKAMRVPIAPAYHQRSRQAHTEERGVRGRPKIRPDICHQGSVLTWTVKAVGMQSTDDALRWNA